MMPNFATFVFDSEIAKRPALHLSPRFGPVDRQPGEPWPQVLRPPGGTARPGGKRKTILTSNNAVHTIQAADPGHARVTFGPIFGTSVLCFGKGA
jgi:hypothetical protein